MKNNKVILGVFLVFCAAFFWSFSGIGVKLLPTTLSPLAITGYRSLFATIILFAAWYATGKEWHASLLKDKFFWAATLCYSFMMILFIAATQLTTAANAIVLQYVAPIFVAIFSFIFLKEKVSRYEWGIVCLAFLGIVLFFAEKISFYGMLGNILALISGLFCALNVLCLRKFSRELNISGTIFVLLCSNIMAVFLCSPFMLNIGALNLSSFITLVFLGFFQLALAFILFVSGLRYISALQASLIATLEAIFNPFWVAIAVGEKPTLLGIIGGCILLFCVSAQSIFRMNNQSF